jgi:putative NADH-flavin reductase
MKLLVMGGSRGIGFETVRRALDQGFEVAAFSRSASKMPLTHERLTKIDGDALDFDQVTAALEGVDAVAQSLGVPLKPKIVARGTHLFSKATAVLVPAMEGKGVNRLVAVTGFGAGDSKKHLPLIQKPAFKVLFGRIYGDKGEQERLIKASRLDWTIARPTVLTNGRRTGRYKVLTDPQDFRMGMISRADVADFLVAAVKDGSYIRQAPVLKS